jgi:hypothetical protein
MNYVTFKGTKIPIYNTPLSNGEILELREKHDNFLIKDVRSGIVNRISNNVQLSRFRIDFGFKPMVYTTALVLAFYNYIQVKKKVKKVMGKNPFSSGGSMNEFIKKEFVTNGAKAVEL